jgi:hypothetical protein
MVNTREKNYYVEIKSLKLRINENYATDKRKKV